MEYQTTTLLIDVERVTIHPRATVARGTGRIVGDGRLVDFVGEPRLLADIAVVIEDSGEPVRCAVERWAVLA